MSGKLYVVGTPIGNMGDFSPRGEEILRTVDFIAAEDTRVSVKLLNRFEIKKPLVSYYEHNKYEKGEIIIERILNGESAAVVTDAGMPCISDPGEQLVKQALAAGITVCSVPGPTAFASALSISGRSTARFCFEGFLPVDKKERTSRLNAAKNYPHTLIFYEAPHKLKKTLKDLYAAFGDREASVIKEITKIHETVQSGTLSALAEYFDQNEPKGEYVIIIEGKTEETVTYTLKTAVEIARKLMSDGTPVSAAAKEAASVTGIKKGEIYKELV